MNTNRPWKEAFGSADPGFADAVNRTLSEIQRQEEEPIVKRKVRASLAFAVMMCLLLAAAAFAATRLGVLDFIVGRYAEEAQILPCATGIIQQNPADTTAHTQFADFTVREAVFDGQYAYVVVAATPTDGKTLLMGPDFDPSLPVSDFGPRFEDEAGSIADYAREIGAERMINTEVAAMSLSDVVFDSMDCMLEEDGTLVHMISGAYEGTADEVEIALKCMTWEGMDALEMDILRFPMKAAGALGEAESADGVDFTDCGVRVDSVKLSATPMAVYATVGFTVVDRAKYDATEGGLWFEFLDEKGERIARGAPAGGSVSPVDEAGTAFIQRDSLGAMEALPEKITLRGYNCWEQNRYEAHEITLTRS